MDKMKFYLWMGWLLLVIGPLAFGTYYRILLGAGLPKKQALVTAFNPFTKIYRRQKGVPLSKEEQLWMWSSIFAVFLWFAFPFFIGIKIG